MEEKFRRNISKALKGRKQTEEHIKNRVLSRKINDNYTVSEKQRAKISRTLIGRKNPSHSIRMSELSKTNPNYGMKNKHHSEEAKQRMRMAKIKNPTNFWRGKKRTVETKRKISLSSKGKPASLGSFRRGDIRLVGKHNPSWQGGKSFEPYGTEFNSNLKEEIRQRDNYTCQECGFTENQLGYKLNVHHVDFDKTNNDPYNLISLCRSCHAQTNFNREDWTEYFQNKIGGAL